MWGTGEHLHCHLEEAQAFSATNCEDNNQTTAATPSIRRWPCLCLFHHPADTAPWPVIAQAGALTLPNNHTVSMPPPSFRRLMLTSRRCPVMVPPFGAARSWSCGAQCPQQPVGVVVVAPTTRTQHNHHPDICFTHTPRRGLGVALCALCTPQRPGTTRG